MANFKATHVGHCQLCGRIHMANYEGKSLAKHGYQVSGWGFFNGVCSGAGYAALELDRTHTDAYILDLRAQADRNDARAVAMPVDGEPTLSLEAHDHLGYEQQRKLEEGKRGRSFAGELKAIRHKLYSKDEAMALGCTEGGWRDLVRYFVRGLQHHAKAMRGHAEMLEKMANVIHGQPLAERPDEVVRQTKVFTRQQMREAYAFEAEKKAAGHKTTTRRNRYNQSITVYY